MTEPSGAWLYTVAVATNGTNIVRSAFTGYIDIEARHLFFYFFESRDDPDKDDVIFWTNGGPGCSSSIGLFMELGTLRCKPCAV